MASGHQKSNVANMLGTVLKDLIANSWTSNSDNSSASKKKVVSESFKKNSKKFNKEDDASVQKLVETLNKLVDAKDEALSEEISRRKDAEQKVEGLRQELEKVQVSGATTEEKDQAKSTVMQLIDVLLEEHSSKSKQQGRSDGKRGVSRGRCRGGRGGGPSARDNEERSYEHSRPGPAKFNNRNNINPGKEDNPKVYNKLSFDDSASGFKMQSDSKPQFFPQVPEKSMNSNVGPVPPYFHQSGSFHGAPGLGPGNHFPHPQQPLNQYYTQPQFGPPNAPFPPQNFPFGPQNFPAPPLFNFPPQHVNLPPQQLNVPPQTFGPQMSSDGLTLGGKKLSPQELSDIKQCLKNDKTNVPGHIQHTKPNYKKRVLNKKQNKDKNEGEKIIGKQNEGAKSVEKEKKGDKIVRKKNEIGNVAEKGEAGVNNNESENVAGKGQGGEKTSRKKKKETNVTEKVNESENKTDEEQKDDCAKPDAGKGKGGENTSGKKKKEMNFTEKINESENKTDEEQKEDGAKPDAGDQKSQDGSSTGAKKKEFKEEKKQGKKKNKNKQASGGGSSAGNPIQLLVRAGIPTEDELRSKSIDINQPVKDFMLVAKDGDKPVSEVPCTVRDMVNFRQKYPNAQVIVIKDQ